MIIETTYSVVVYLDGRWVPQWMKHKAYSNVNASYKLRDAEDRMANGQYQFMVVEKGTDLTKLEPPT